MSTHKKKNSKIEVSIKRW